MATSESGTVRVEKDIVFGNGGGRELKLDVYYPDAAADKRTAVIQLYGGGFTAGSKDGRNTISATMLAQRGYLGICTTYRLAPETKWPQQLYDVKATIRWTRAHASELGIDPDKITLAGYSAGGLLALLAAGTPNRSELEGDVGTPDVGSQVAAVMAYFAATPRKASDGSDHVLMPAGSAEAAYAEVDPFRYISPAYPPAIFFHGSADTTVPYSQSQRFSEELRAAGVATELHIFDSMPHIFDRYEPYGGMCADLSDAFLDRTIVEPRGYERPVIAATVTG